MLLGAFLTLLTLTYVQNQCVSRDFGNGGTVCVCNSTYCDTISTPIRPNNDEFLVYTSNQAGLRFHLTSGSFLVNNSSKSNIDATKQYQRILGFGGAFTDATGINILKLPPKLRDTLMRGYFSTDGIEYTTGRVPIGGCDFSTRPYSYDDRSPDPELRHFNLTFEDFDYKIPFIKQAMELSANKLLLFGSAWTAPKWMKTNDAYTGLGFIKECYLQTWANYHLRFLEEYQKNGVQFWGLTTGNEPSDALLRGETLEVVYWTPPYASRWIAEHLGPTIRKSPHHNIKIMILDDQRTFLPWYVQNILRHENARHYVDGIAVHWYFDSFSSPFLLNLTQNIFPDAFILYTEACNGFEPHAIPVILGSWARGERYSNDILGDLLNGAIGWTDWNMALDPQGGPNYIQNFVDSPIIINETSGEFFKQPMFYHLGHFSKFIQRNSKRIELNLDNSMVDSVAFLRPDNGTAIVLLNQKNITIWLNITAGSRGLIPLELSERSITTVLYW